VKQVVGNGREPANYLGAWQWTDPAPFDEEPAPTAPAAPAYPPAPSPRRRVRVNIEFGQ